MELPIFRSCIALEFHCGEYRITGLPGRPLRFRWIFCGVACQHDIVWNKDPHWIEESRILPVILRTVAPVEARMVFARLQIRLSDVHLTLEIHTKKLHFGGLNQEERMMTVKTRYLKLASAQIFAIFTLLVFNVCFATDDFFDNQPLIAQFIDGSLSDGMGYSFYGCMLRSSYYMDSALKENDPNQALIFRKAAWINMVNAHRMLDSIYQDMHSPAMRIQTLNQMKQIGSIIDRIGKTSFKWDSKKTREMYSKTRMMIEERMKAINTYCFGIRE
ncbi:MAG: hypothetical protein ABSG91_07495 [Syntrophobacteraceae bacterium]|jgi:hypothetical protein